MKTEHFHVIAPFSHDIKWLPYHVYHYPERLVSKSTYTVKKSDRQILRQKVFLHKKPTQLLACLTCAIHERFLYSKSNSLLNFFDATIGFDAVTIFASVELLRLHLSVRLEWLSFTFPISNSCWSWLFDGRRKRITTGQAMRGTSALLNPIQNKEHNYSTYPVCPPKRWHRVYWQLCNF